jgi:hypothetical protein
VPFTPATVAGSSSLAVCMDWPATPPAPSVPTGSSTTPTLLLSGEDDLRTPYEQDLTIGSTYSDARLLRIPDVGHSAVSADDSGCARTAMIEFLSAGQAPASCPGSREPQALPLPPRSLREVNTAGSRSSAHLAAQVAAAAAITLEDLFGQASSSGGGLRGGYWALSSRGFVLHGVLDVPGVALSGTVGVEGSTNGLPNFTGHLTIRGRVAGELTLRGLVLSGRVARARVQTHLAAV